MHKGLLMNVMRRNDDAIKTAAGNLKKKIPDGFEQSQFFPFMPWFS